MKDLLGQLFGDEGHHRVQQPDCLCQNPGGNTPGFAGIPLIRQLRLDQLKIPVTVIVPDKLIDAVRGLIETVFLDRNGNLFGGIGQLGDDPLIDRFFRIVEAFRHAFRAAIHFQKTAGIPDFGGEIPVTFDPAFGQLDIPALRRHRRQREAQRISPIFFGKIERVHDIALGFGHFLALLITDQRMDIDITERHLTAPEMHAHHHHPGNPEKDDIKPGDQNITGVIAVDLNGFFGPAEG